MANIGDTPNLNLGDEDERNESDEEDEQNSTMERAQPIARESILPSQPATDMVSNAITDQITDHLMGSDFGNNASSRYVTLPSQYYGINTNDVIRTLVWTYNNLFPVQLGNTEPWPSVVTLNLNQGGQGAARIAQPFESWQPLTVTWTFSTTITEYFPPLAQTTPVQYTQPSTMPASIVLNSIGPSRLVNNENSHPNTGETTQNTHDEIMTPPMFIETQATVIGNAETGIPKEISRDDEFSVSTNERQNGNESDTSSDDEQLLRRESSPHVRGSNDDELTCNTDQRAEVPPNTEIIPVINQYNTSPNQANVVDEQANTTTSGTDSPPSRGPETERSVDAPTEGDPSMIFTALDPTIINVPKQRTPSSSSDESVAEINT